MFTVIYYDGPKGQRFSVVKTINEEAELETLPNVIYVDRFNDDEKVEIKSFNEILGFRNRRVGQPDNR